MSSELTDSYISLLRTMSSELMDSETAVLHQFIGTMSSELTDSETTITGVPNPLGGQQRNNNDEEDDLAERA